MSQHLAAVSLVVPDYDEAIAFYVGKLGFARIEDTPLGAGKRWVLVAPPGAVETRLLLAKADSDLQRRAIGNQTGGRVFLFLHTDDFDRDYNAYLKAGIDFLEKTRLEPYGKVVVFRDPFGNQWDLIEPGFRSGASSAG